MDLLCIMGKKWAFEVLETIQQNKSAQFNKIKSILKLNSSTLSGTLKDFQDAGIVKRKVLKNSPLEVRYSLSEKGNSVYHHTKAIADLN